MSLVAFGDLSICSAIAENLAIFILPEPQRT
jgi:hypothetical protein